MNDNNNENGNNNMNKIKRIGSIGIIIILIVLISIAMPSLLKRRYSVKKTNSDTYSAVLQYTGAVIGGIITMIGIIIAFEESESDRKQREQENKKKRKQREREIENERKLEYAPRLALSLRDRNNPVVCGYMHYSKYEYNDKYWETIKDEEEREEKKKKEKNILDNKNDKCGVSFVIKNVGKSEIEIERIKVEPALLREGLLRVSDNNEPTENNEQTEKDGVVKGYLLPLENNQQPGAFTPLTFRLMPGESRDFDLSVKLFKKIYGKYSRYLLYITCNNKEERFIRTFQVDLKIKDVDLELKDGDLELKDGDLELKDGDLELKDGDLELKDVDVKLKDGDLKLKDVKGYPYRSWSHATLWDRESRKIGDVKALDINTRIEDQDEKIRRLTDQLEEAKDEEKLHEAKNYQ